MWNQRLLWYKYDFNWEAMHVIPHYTGALSMIGSGYIIFDVLREWRKKLRMPKYRILMILSIYDFLASFWFFMARWAGGSVANLDVSGTSRTCEASGFFVQLGMIAIPLYNVTLSTQWFLAIRHNWNEVRIWKDFERYAHICIILSALILAVVPLPMELYNQWYFYCYVTQALYNPETGKFERGTLKAARAIQMTTLVVVFLSAIVVTALMISIFCAVRNITRRANAYEFSSGLSSTSISRFRSNRSIRHNSSSLRNSSQVRRRVAMTQQIKTLALLYSIPFYLTWVIPAIIYLRGQLMFSQQVPPVKKPVLTYIGVIYVSVALPLQGFLNGCIYLYQRYRNSIRTTTNSICLSRCDFFRGWCCCRARKEQTDETVDIAGEEIIIPFREDSGDKESETGSVIDEADYLPEGGETEGSVDKMFEKGNETDETVETVDEAGEEIIIPFPEDSGDKESETGSDEADYLPEGGETDGSVDKMFEKGNETDDDFVENSQDENV